MGRNHRQLFGYSVLSTTEMMSAERISYDEYVQHVRWNYACDSFKRMEYCPMSGVPYGMESPSYYDLKDAEITAPGSDECTTPGPNSVCLRPEPSDLYDDPLSKPDESTKKKGSATSSPPRRCRISTGSSSNSNCIAIDPETPVRQGAQVDVPEFTPEPPNVKELYLMRRHDKVQGDSSTAKCLKLSA